MFYGAAIPTVFMALTAVSLTAILAYAPLQLRFASEIVLDALALLLLGIRGAEAEGTLWVGQHRGRKIHQIDPQTGAILRTIESNRMVTGVTWVHGELWHGTWEGDESEVRRVDPRTGQVLERLDMPPGVAVSWLESDGGDRFFCGGGRSGKVRAIRRPKRGSAPGSGPRIPADSASN